MLKNDNNVLLNVRDLVIEFRNKGKKFKAVKGVNFDIYKREIFGLVGESGSGKTTIGRAIAGVQPLADGSIYLDNELIAGSPTSLFELNKEIYKKIKFVATKYSINCNYIDKIIIDFKNNYNKFKNDSILLSDGSWRKAFASSRLSLVHKLTKENLKFLNEIIKDFKRINQFVKNIHDFIPEISVELENSILAKNTDTLDIVLKLKNKMSLDFHDLNEMKIKANESKKKFSKIAKAESEAKKKSKDLEKKLISLAEKEADININKLKKQSVESIEEKINKIEIIKQEKIINARNKSEALFKEEIEKILKPNEYDDLIELVEFMFKKLQLIRENDDRIQRRIKIAITLEEQNLDLSSPEKFKNKLIRKYLSKIYVSKLDFINEFKKAKNNPEIKVSLNSEKMFSEITSIDQNNDAKKDEFIKDKNLIDEFYRWKNTEIQLTERQIATIVELIEYLKLPSIDYLVSKSFLFSKPSKSRKRQNRKNVQMIFQDPGSSLNERMSVEEVIAEGLENFPELYKSVEMRQEYVDSFNELNPENKISIDQIEKDSDIKKYIILKLIRSVGLLPEHLSRYPHEFSGGQKQRIGIARSLALKPKIIIADEPISALDVSIRAQVLNLFQLFKKEYDLTYLFVTHDLSVVKFIADRIAVIYHGDIVEMASAEELFKNPLHPYTRSLLSAIPQPDPDYKFDDELIVYNPEKEHYDYIFDLPEFTEVSENHFVLANKRELGQIEKITKKVIQKPLKSKKEDLKTIEPKKETLNQETDEFLKNLENKYNDHLEKEVYVEDEKNDDLNAKKVQTKISAAERAKIDGSDIIEESRAELQKYSNKLRDVAIKNKLSKSLQKVNLRDMTKKELIEYMRKVRAGVTAKNS